MKRPRIVAAMMLKLPIFVLILSQLFMHGSSCFTRPVHPETDFSHTTTHVADIGEEIVLVGPSPKVDLFNPAQKSWRELHYNSRNEMREEATITTLGSLLFVAGGQSYDDAHDMTGETMDVVDMHSSASWTVSFNRTLPIGSRAVAAGSMVLFYHPRSFTIMTYNMTDHVTTIMDKSIMYQGAAMYEEMIYLVDRARIDAYNTTDGTWRNTPLRARIRYGINLVFAARVNNAPTLLVVTFRDVVRVDPVSGTFTSLVTIGFVRSGVIHNNLMVLLFGPSKAVVNSIVIYNVRDDHRYSWQYDDYSFRYSAVAALNNTLYIANWRPNANFDSGRRLLVYNVDHSHHDFIRLKPMDYVLQYRDSMVGAHFSSQDTRVTVHDLTSAQTTEIQVNFTQRGRVLARAAADYVFFYGGELEGSTEQPLDLLVLCMQTREQWYIATVPSPYRADMVRALGNLIFFPEDTDPVIHVFDASARQWTQRTELASKTIPDMVVRTADSIVYLSTIRDTTAFDIYYAASHTWKTLDLEVGSRLHGVALVQNHLYVAGGMASNGTLLNSLIIFSLNTTNKATVHLSQPRALPAVRQLGSYIAVIGGVKDDHLRLSDVINIFQLNGEIRHNMQLQPERLGLNFGTTTIGDSLYSRYNSNVYRFDSNAPSSTAPNPHRLLLPVMAGSAIRAVGSYLVAWGEFYNQQEFYFYDTTTPTSLHLITPLSRGVFFWRNSVILYFNGIMKIDLPVVSSLKEKTLYLPDHASWTPSAYGRGLKYSWEMRPLGQLELRIPGVAETFDIGPCQLQGGKHELSLTITDRCGLSTRVIGGVNVIPAPNVTPAGWKSDYECNSSPKLYALVEHAANPQWMIDGRSRTGDTLVLEGLTCGRTYNICVLASNPSGVTSKCKDIRINANLLKILLPIAGGLGLGLVATVVGVTRRKFMKVKKQELELKSMLSEAKREMIDSKAGKIISSTSWEWTPSAAYTYCALNQLPVTFDTSQLGFDKKHGPLDINIWFQGTIMATSKKKAKTGRLSFLHLSLLDDEHRFDIYAPQSPKFEVNVDPSSFVLSDGGAVMLTVWIKLKITTKADIQLVIVSERTRRYSSITFTVVGKPSPWIDVDDVEVSDQILGQGGFGTVKKGTYKGQSVAVKILLNQYMTIHTKTEFEREVAVMSSLHHPNIVQFVGASNIEGKLALVTELAPLGNLASILEESLLSVQLKIIILLEIARAIQFLHSNSVIHRDIKPLNVLVYSLEHKAMCHVKLTDFGTSKFVSDSAAMTMTQNIGTTKYMAPETLGKKPRFDKAADVYSFAILAWEVITNEHAFAAAEFQWQSEIENFVLKGGRLPIPADMNDKLACLITQCWHQDATKRPSISEVVQQLSKFIYGDSYAFV